MTTRASTQTNTALTIAIITLVIIASIVIPKILDIVTIILVIVSSSPRLQYNPHQYIKLTAAMTASPKTMKNRANATYLISDYDNLSRGLMTVMMTVGLLRSLL